MVSSAWLDYCSSNTKHINIWRLHTMLRKITEYFTIAIGYGKKGLIVSLDSIDVSVNGMIKQDWHPLGSITEVDNTSNGEI